MFQIVPYLFVLVNHIRLLKCRNKNADKRIKFLPVNLMICVVWSFALLFEIGLTTYQRIGDYNLYIMGINCFISLQLLIYWCGKYWVFSKVSKGMGSSRDVRN